MIDAGHKQPAIDNVIPYLKKENIQVINHFFISHAHKDHYEGLVPIINSGIKVNNVYFKKPPKDICDREIPWGCDWNDLERLELFLSMAGVNVIDPSTGDVLEVGDDSVFEFLHIQEDDIGDDRVDINDLSFIMKWKVGFFSVLFTGDLNKKVSEVISSNPGIKSDFLKVPHHGGRSLATNNFFDSVGPDYAVVPGPSWVWCGDRGDRAREWMFDNNVITLVNGLHGHIKISFYGDSGRATYEKNTTCEEYKKLLIENNGFDFKKESSMAHIIGLLLLD